MFYYSIWWRYWHDFIAGISIKGDGGFIKLTSAMQKRFLCTRTHALT